MRSTFYDDVQDIAIRQAFKLGPIPQTSRRVPNSSIYWTGDGVCHLRPQRYSPVAGEVSGEFADDAFWLPPPLSRKPPSRRNVKKPRVGPVHASASRGPRREHAAHARTLASTSSSAAVSERAATDRPRHARSQTDSARARRRQSTEGAVDRTPPVLVSRAQGGLPSVTPKKDASARSGQSKSPSAAPITSMDGGGGAAPQSGPTRPVLGHPSPISLSAHGRVEADVRYVAGGQPRLSPIKNRHSPTADLHAPPVSLTNAAASKQRGNARSAKPKTASMPKPVSASPRVLPLATTPPPPLKPITPASPLTPLPARHSTSPYKPTNTSARDARSPAEPLGSRGSRPPSKPTSASATPTALAAASPPSTLATPSPPAPRDSERHSANSSVLHSESEEGDGGNRSTEQGAVAAIPPTFSLLSDSDDDSDFSSLAGDSHAPPATAAVQLEKAYTPIESPTESMRPTQVAAVVGAGGLISPPSPRTITGSHADSASTTNSASPLQQDASALTAADGLADHDTSCVVPLEAANTAASDRRGSDEAVAGTIASTEQVDPVSGAVAIDAPSPTAALAVVEVTAGEHVADAVVDYGPTSALDAEVEVGSVAVSPTDDATDRPKDEVGGDAGGDAGALCAQPATEAFVKPVADMATSANENGVHKAGEVEVVATFPDSGSQEDLDAQSRVAETGCSETITPTMSANLPGEDTAVASSLPLPDSDVEIEDDGGVTSASCLTSPAQSVDTTNEDAISTDCVAPAAALETAADADVASETPSGDGEVVTTEETDVSAGDTPPRNGEVVATGTEADRATAGDEAANDTSGTAEAASDDVVRGPAPVLVEAGVETGEDNPAVQSGADSEVESQENPIGEDAASSNCDQQHEATTSTSNSEPQNSASLPEGDGEVKPIVSTTSNNSDGDDAASPPAVSSPSAISGREAQSDDTVALLPTEVEEASLTATSAPEPAAVPENEAAGASSGEQEGQALASDATELGTVASSDGEQEGSVNESILKGEDVLVDAGVANNAEQEDVSERQAVAVEASSLAEVEEEDAQGVSAYTPAEEEDTASVPTASSSSAEQQTAEEPAPTVADEAVIAVSAPASVAVSPPLPSGQQKVAEGPTEARQGDSASAPPTEEEKGECTHTSSSPIPKQPVAGEGLSPAEVQDEKAGASTSAPSVLSCEAEFEDIADANVAASPPSERPARLSQASLVDAAKPNAAAPVLDVSKAAAQRASAGDSDSDAPPLSDRERVRLSTIKHSQLASFVKSDAALTGKEAEIALESAKSILTLVSTSRAFQDGPKQRLLGKARRSRGGSGSKLKAVSESIVTDSELAVEAASADERSPQKARPTKKGEKLTSWALSCLFVISEGATQSDCKPVLSKNISSFGGPVAIMRSSSERLLILTVRAESPGCLVHSCEEVAVGEPQVSTSAPTGLSQRRKKFDDGAAKSAICLRFVESSRGATPDELVVQLAFDGTDDSWPYTARNECLLLPVVLKVRVMVLLDDVWHLLATVFPLRALLSCQLFPNFEDAETATYLSKVGKLQTMTPQGFYSVSANTARDPAPE